MEAYHIARICHEANRAYCHTIGDYSQRPWNESPDWQMVSAIAGVKFHQEFPDAPPSASHDAWLAEKQKAGWIYGPRKDPENKQHPSMRLFHELGEREQMKDVLFTAIVKALS